MPEVIMQQNISILIASLSKSFPGATVTVRSFGPLQVENGEVSIGNATETVLSLGEDRRKEIHPLSVGEIETGRDLELAKRLNRAAGRSKKCLK